MFFISFFYGIFFLDYRRVTFEFLTPYSLFSDFSLVFTLDLVSLLFFSSISLISGVVFLYSKFYIDESFSFFNLDNKRFFFLLFLFVMSMIFLVFSGSWVIVLLGWDGLGLVSFLLVIYYNNSSRLDSGLITVFINRVGDCFFILRFILIFSFGWLSLDFLSFYSCLGFSIVILLGAITKRAQIPFSSWLPAAIAAPTPVSSLVHSSTLVTAGVYLIIRFNYLLEERFFLLSIISLFTMCLAGLCALFELDFKKVVAISTLSQLGFMLFSISVGGWLLSFLHMIFHAFFKRTLFFSTGRIIHYLSGQQDSRFFGSLSSTFFSKLFFSISCLRLIGAPFSLGFYSKDSIIGLGIRGALRLHFFLFLLGCIFTVSYSLRLIYIGFFNFPSYNTSISFSDSIFFFFPIFSLYIFCVFIGNIFFFLLLPPLDLSFFDCFFGIIIIFGGIFLFSYVSINSLGLSVFITISFLSLLSSSFLSSSLKSFLYSYECTWSEFLGGKGALSLITKTGDFLVFFYRLRFLSSFIIFLVVFTILIYVFSPIRALTLKGLEILGIKVLR